MAKYTGPTSSDPLNPKPDPNRYDDAATDVGADKDGGYGASKKASDQLDADKANTPKFNADEEQRGMAGHSKVDAGDGNPFNSNPPVDPIVLAERKMKAAETEADAAIERADNAAKVARAAAEDMKSNNAEQKKLLTEQRDASQKAADEAMTPSERDAEKARKEKQEKADRDNKEKPFGA